MLALAGLVHANGIWRDHVEPQLRVTVAPPVFSVVQGAVNEVFSHDLILWATFGGALALWQVSGVIRAIMGALGRIYEAPAERSFFRRFTISFALSIEVGGCFVLAAICVLFAPFFWTTNHGLLGEITGLTVRWTLVILLLGFVVGLLLRHCPARPQTVSWVSLGTLIVILTWILASVVFYIYLTDIASYQSVFGNLAAVIVALAYLYISSIAFLFGAQLDALIRVQHTGCAAGDEP